MPYTYPTHIQAYWMVDDVEEVSFHIFGARHFGRLTSVLVKPIAEVDNSGLQDVVDLDTTPQPSSSSAKPNRPEDEDQAEDDLTACTDNNINTSAPSVDTADDTADIVCYTSREPVRKASNGRGR